MRDTVGLMLRDAWKQQGKPNCSHHQLIREHSSSGAVTGCYICTTCGQIMQMHQLGEGRITHTSRLRDGAKKGTGIQDPR